MLQGVGNGRLHDVTEYERVDNDTRLVVQRLMKEGKEAKTEMNQVELALPHKSLFVRNCRRFETS